jgi:hypothetical protein
MFNLDLSKLHIPYKYDDRAIGRKLQAIAKYVFMAAGAIAVFGAYLFFFKEGEINNWPWTLGFGACVMAICLRIAKFIKLAYLLNIIIWILMFVSLAITTDDGFTNREWGVAVFGAAAIVFFIGVFMNAKGDIYLKAYKQEHPFRNM